MNAIQITRDWHILQANKITLGAVWEIWGPCTSNTDVSEKFPEPGVTASMN
jgi:hypothetical protein